MSINVEAYSAMNRAKNLNSINGRESAPRFSKPLFAIVAQNPIPSMISLLLQNNTDFDCGPDGSAHNTLAIQSVRIGKQPIKFNAQDYYNAEKPDILGDWSLRVQFQLLFPK